MRKYWMLMVSLAVMFWGVRARAAVDPAWTTPIAPFRIADNLYYVGSQDLAVYLITTPEGGILINSNLESSPPQIQHSVEQLGFHMRDIKILLIVHGHWDHDAGSADILKRTGAKYMVMEEDVPVVESGGAKDFFYGKSGTRYPPAHVDRVLHDGDEVRLGGVVLHAHRTPGHSKGCTTWTMEAMDGGKRRQVVIAGGWTVNEGFRLVDRPGQPASYPGIAKDFEHTFAVLKSLPCDIFLGAHGAYFGMKAKLARAAAGEHDVWVDPAGYKATVANREGAFRTELARQEAGGK